MSDTGSTADQGAGSDPGTTGAIFDPRLGEYAYDLWNHANAAAFGSEISSLRSALASADDLYTPFDRGGHGVAGGWLETLDHFIDTLSNDLSTLSSAMESGDWSTIDTQVWVIRFAVDNLKDTTEDGPGHCIDMATNSIDIILGQVHGGGARRLLKALIEQADGVYGALEAFGEAGSQVGELFAEAFDLEPAGTATQVSSRGSQQRLPSALSSLRERWGKLGSYVSAADAMSDESDDTLREVGNDYLRKDPFSLGLTIEPAST